MVCNGQQLQIPFAYSEAIYKPFPAFHYLVVLAAACVGRRRPCSCLATCNHGVLHVQRSLLPLTDARDAQKRDWVKTVIAEDANRFITLEHVAARLAWNWFSCEATIDQDYLFLSYAIVAKVRIPGQRTDNY